MQETQVQSLGWEDPLEKEMATHSSILAWEIPWTEEPGRLQSMGSQESDMTWQLNNNNKGQGDCLCNLNLEAAWGTGGVATCYIAVVSLLSHVQLFATPWTVAP